MALSHAILAALTDMPSSGYELARRFDASVSFFWGATHQQIYRELAKLEADKCVSVKVLHQVNRPDKKIYSITEIGQQVLLSWLKTSASLPPIKDDLLVKLFAGHQVAPDILLAELRHHRKQHQTRLVEFQALEDRLFPDVNNLTLKETYQYLTLRRGIQGEQGWLKWCDEVIATLQDLNSAPEAKEEGKS